MLGRLGTWCYRHHLVVLFLWVSVTIGGALSAGPVLNRLVDDSLPSTMESIAGRDALKASRNGTEQIVAVLDGVDVRAPRVEKILVAAATDLATHKHVRSVRQAYAKPAGDPPVGDVLLVTITVDQIDDHAAAAEVQDRIRTRLQTSRQNLVEAGYPDARVRLGGDPIRGRQASETLQKDLLRAEITSLPVTLVVLVFVFGGFVTAGLPVITAVASSAGAVAGLLAFSYVVDIDQNALTLVTLLGLGLSIDYVLLLIARFREELAAGAMTAEAVGRACQAAGRTILFSALTVVAALAGLITFSLTALAALGTAGISVALVAMAAALTLAPALLGLTRRRQYLGSHLETSAGRPARWVSRHVAGDRGIFTAVARLVQRRAVVVALSASALLLASAVPLTQAVVKIPQLENLPSRLEAVAVAHELVDRFGQSPPAVTVVARTDAKALGAWANRWESDAAVSDILPARQTSGGLATIDLVLHDDAQDRAAQNLVKDIRAHRPEGGPSWVTGDAAVLVDTKDVISDDLPLALAVTGAAMFCLLFLMTGSVVVPLKAIVANVLSLGASCGILVLVFQQGYGAGLLGTLTVGGLDPFVLVIVFALSFALAMDYEVFLLGRIRENVDQGMDTDVAVRHGLQSTGRIITSAGLLMVIVFGCFVTAETGRIQQIGLGLAVAVLIDATVVRCLLVPASMTMLGRWNWWTPAILERVHRVIALRDSAPLQGRSPDPSEPAGSQHRTTTPAPASEVAHVTGRRPPTGVVYDVRGLTKSYPGQADPANRTVDLEVRSGETFCILGANGCGKSTLVRQMAALTRPDAGTITFFGQDIADADVPMNVGYMSQSSVALGHLTVPEAIYFTGRLRGLSRRAAAAHRDELIMQCDLERCTTSTSRNLSGGQRRLLHLALTMVGRPPVLILDEPTNDLDTQHRRLVWKICGDLSREYGTTIIVITHDAAEVERAADRVGVMHRGEFVAVGTPAELRRGLGEAMRLRISRPAGQTPRRLGGFHQWREEEPGRWVLLLQPPQLVEAVAQIDPADLHDLRIEAMSLEELYQAVLADITSLAAVTA
jgi:RND superfamily putative drug exporter